MATQRGPADPSFEGGPLRGGDDDRVGAAVLRVALAVLVFAFAMWLALSLVICSAASGTTSDAMSPRSTALSPRMANRLVKSVRQRPRTEWGRWRRVHALQRLERAHHPAVPRLVGRVLDDPDQRIASAAIHTLGEIGDDWAIDILVDALRRGHGPRSKIAAELEELVPAPGQRLLSLLRDWNPAVRFWGATLLGPYPDLGGATLIELTWDPTRTSALPRSRRSAREREPAWSGPGGTARRPRVVRAGPRRAGCGACSGR